MPFHLRPYRAQDFDRLWEIDQLCFPEGIAYTQMELDGFLRRRNAIALVAEGDAGDPDTGADPAKADPGVIRPQSRVVGFVVAHRQREKVGRIVTLDILPEARRQGLASQLMRECEDRLRAAGCNRVYLETAVNNQPAVQLYSQLGYNILRILPEYYSAQNLDAYQMGKQL